MPPRWTLITSHGSTLMLIARNQQITTREVASRLGLAERSVLRIIKDLEQEGYIRKQKVGRRNHYEVKMETPMRRPEMHHVPVGDFLELLDKRNGGTRRDVAEEPATGS